MNSTVPFSILVIDTSSTEIGLGLHRSGRPLATIRHRPSGPVSENLHAGIGRLLDAEGVRNQDLTAIAAIRGPGSFTGLRVGLSYALGLSMALAIPGIGISSLEAIAAGIAISRPELRRLLVAIRSGERRNDWYSEIFRLDPGESPHSTGEAAALEAPALETLAQEADAVAGDPPIFASKVPVCGDRFSLLAGAAELARRSVQGGSSNDPLLPLYILEPPPVARRAAASTAESS